MDLKEYYKVERIEENGETFETFHRERCGFRTIEGYARASFNKAVESGKYVEVNWYYKNNYGQWVIFEQYKKE